MENPIKMDDLRGFTLIFGNTHVSITSSPTPAGPKGARTVPPTAAPTVEETAEVS